MICFCVSMKFRCFYTTLDVRACQGIDHSIFFDDEFLSYMLRKKCGKSACSFRVFFRRHVTFFISIGTKILLEIFSSLHFVPVWCLECQFVGERDCPRNIHSTYHSHFDETHVRNSFTSSIKISSSRDAKTQENSSIKILLNEHFLNIRDRS